MQSRSFVGLCKWSIYRVQLQVGVLKFELLFSLVQSSFKCVLARNFELRSLFHVEFFGGCLFFLDVENENMIRFITMFMVSLAPFRFIHLQQDRPCS